MFRAISGMDDFAKAASDSWTLLKELIAQLPIDKKDKQILQTAIETADLYLKSGYRMHCSDDCECQSHCTVYALSQPNKVPFSQACSHEHKSICEGEVISLFMSHKMQF
jgi:hypothetical protein